MRTRNELRILNGAACIAVFGLSALVANPFVPDVCASRGWGWPLPAYIHWCECFIEAPPAAVNPLYLSVDLFFWTVAWLMLTEVLCKHQRTSH